MISPVCQSRRRVEFRRAFTLVEALATIVILAVLGSLTSFIMMSAVDSYVDGGVRARMHDEMSLAMEQIVRDLREIERHPEEHRSGPFITELNSASIRWHEGERLYLNDGALVRRRAGGSPRTLMADVERFAIRAYDERNDPLEETLAGEDCDDIHRIELVLTCHRRDVEETLRARVFLRCLIDLEV